MDEVEQERGAVGPPVAHDDVTVEVELEPLEVVRREVPDCWSRVTVAFVLARETLVAGNGRPAASSQRHPSIELLSDDRTRARVDNAERWMDEVAVLGMLEAKQLAVRGERSTEEPFQLGAPEPHRASGTVDLPCAAAVDRDVDGEALAVGDRRDDDPRRLGEPFAPAVRHAVEEERRLASVERLHVPAAGLVATLVLEPENALALERRDGIDEAHRMVGHLPSCARLGIERVDLPDAGLVGDVDGVTRSGGRPFGEIRDGGSKALFPGGRAHRGEATNRESKPPGREADGFRDFARSGRPR